VSRILRVAALFGAFAAALGFASLNSSQRVTLRLGFVTVYDLPLTAVAFGSLLVGMLVMLLAGVRTDLKVRRILRARLLAEDREERARFVDGDQQDLFGEGKEKD
jgi:uncharacterized integral membrane protein